MEVTDAADLGPRGPFDTVTASLVLFFLPDPAAALTAWLSLLAPGGRLGITTFGEAGPGDDRARRPADPLRPARSVRPTRLPGGGPVRQRGRDATLFGSCCAPDVELVAEHVSLPFANVAAWERFSRTTGQSAMWRRVPHADLPRVRAQAAELLTGPLVWERRRSGSPLSTVSPTRLGDPQSPSAARPAVPPPEAAPYRHDRLARRSSPVFGLSFSGIEASLPASGASTRSRKWTSSCSLRGMRMRP